LVSREGAKGAKAQEFFKISILGVFAALREINLAAELLGLL